MLVVICGPSGSGKTKVLNDIVKTIESGKDWKGIIPCSNGGSFNDPNGNRVTFKNAMKVEALRNLSFLDNPDETILFKTRQTDDVLRIIEDYRSDIPEIIFSRADIVLHVGHLSNGSDVYVMKNRHGKAKQIFAFIINQEGNLVWDKDE